MIAVWIVMQNSMLISWLARATLECLEKDRESALNYVTDIKISQLVATEQIMFRNNLLTNCNKLERHIRLVTRLCYRHVVTWLPQSWQVPHIKPVTLLLTLLQYFHVSQMSQKYLTGRSYKNNEFDCPFHIWWLYDMKV